MGGELPGPLGVSVFEDEPQAADAAAMARLNANPKTALRTTPSFFLIFVLPKPPDNPCSCINRYV